MSIGVFGATATFLPSNFTDQGTSGTGSEISATVNTVTFSCNKGYGTTQFRCYKNGTITILSTNTITDISFSFSGSYNGGMSTSYTNLNTTSWSFKCTSQARITQCVVTYSGGQSYTIAEQSNNNSYGTVSKDGNVITASPNTCYTYASPAYTVSPANSATVSQSGNNFTVTPSANTTITINFEAIPTYTVTYNANGGNVSPQSNAQQSCNESVTLPTPTQDGYTFTGWFDAQSGGNRIGGGGNSYKPTSNITLYAQWLENINCDGDSYDFSLIDDFSSWGTGYGEKILIYTNDSIILSSANRQTQTITDIPVTKGSDIEVLARNGGKISSINLICRQWSNKAQTITLHYSTDGGSTYTSTNVTSDNFRLSYDNFDINTNAVKFTFSSANQIGIESLCVGHEACTSEVTVTKIPGENGDFNLSKTTVCGDGDGGEVIVSDIEPSDGYEIDGIICVNASFQTVGSVNQTTHVVSGITEDCFIGVLFKEKIVPDIQVVEWNPDYIKVDIENFSAVSAVLEDQNTQADVQENVAEGLFFSKYFEAGGENKMLAIYNGTKSKIDLTGYFIQSCANGGRLFLNDFGRHETGWIYPQEELIFGVYDDTNSAESCATEIDGHEDWYTFTKGGGESPTGFESALSFGGRTSVALYKIQGVGDTAMIDIIGAYYINPGLSVFDRLAKIHKDCGVNSGAYLKIDDIKWNDQASFWVLDGDNLKTKNIENNYPLSTNRCLLVRKNTVKSGAHAVATNIINSDTLNYTSDNNCAVMPHAFKTLSEEWSGYRIGAGASGGQDLIDSTCTGFAYAGHYDYSEHYIEFDVIKSIPISASIVDGYYQINIPQLDTLSCTNLKIIVKEEGTNNELEETYKIPIMITENTTTTTAKFFNKRDCDECDVVVLAGKKLTVDGILSENRDLKLYEGARLNVPSGTEYTLKSLAFRRNNDSVSSIYMGGGELHLNKLYFDLYITPDDWQYVSIPSIFKASDVKFINGKTPKYGEDFTIGYYDGNDRAINKKDGWKLASIGKEFIPGQGFILGLDDKHKRKEFRIEIPIDSIVGESHNKKITDLHSWGAQRDVTPNHKGWNLIGNPYMSYYDTDFSTPIKVGELVKDSTGNQWNGRWVYKAGSEIKNLRYAVIPSKDAIDEAAGGYKSVLLDSYELRPFTAFFVQIGGENENTQTICLNNAKRINKMIARSYQEQEDDELFLRVKVDNWKTGCFISNKFTEEYEPGDDLESRYPIYQSIGGYNLLYSAINDSIIEHGVQVTSPNGILYLDEKVNTNKFEYIYANHNGSWYDLIHGETVDIETGNFILQAKRKHNNVATGLYVLPTNGIYKFSDGKDIYINRNNCIFNILGKKIK
jgi:uncharacterized repeat protein (TIGR02543 family)